MAGFKYIKKVRTASGKWRYIYSTRGSGSGRNTPIPKPQFGVEDYTSDRMRNTANLIRAYKTAKNVYDTWSRWSENNRKTAAKVIKKVVEYASDTYKQYNEQKRRDEAKQTDSNRQSSRSTRSTRSRRRNPSGRSATVRVRKRKTLENPFR